MEHNSVVSGYPKSTGILWVDGLSMGPPDFRGITLKQEEESIRDFTRRFGQDV